MKFRGDEVRTRVLVVAIALVLTLAPGTSCSQFGSHPSDASMMYHFSTHKAVFEQLVSMSSVDKEIVRLAPDFVYPENAPGFSVDRWQEYRRLFQQIGSRNGLCRYESELPGVVFVLYSDKGLATGGSSKGYVYSATSLGYVYSATSLEPLYESLDEPPSDLRSNIKAYRRIDDSWYIFYSWDD